LSVSRLLTSVFLVLSSAGVNASPAASLVVTDCVPLGAPCPFRPKVAGQPFSFYVVPVDASSFQVASDYSGTVTITSSDPTALLPPPHTFALGDNSYYSFQFTITINSVNLNGSPPQLIYNVFAHDTNGLAGTGGFFYLPAPAPPQPAPLGSPVISLVLFVLITSLAACSLRSRRHAP